MQQISNALAVFHSLLFWYMHFNELFQQKKRHIYYDASDLVINVFFSYLYCEHEELLHLLALIILHL